MAGEQQDDKNAMSILWIIGTIFTIGLIIWIGFSVQLKYLFLRLRWVQLTLIWWVVKWLPSLDIFVAMQQEVAKALYYADNLGVQQLNSEIAIYFSELVGSYVRYPAAIIMLWFSYMMFSKNVSIKYRKSYDMHRLATQEASEWPQINPVLKQNIIDSDINKGPWAIAKSPLEFAKFYNLIAIEVQLPQGPLQPKPKFNMHLDKAKASQVFSSQLGRLWQGVQYLPIHKRALFAALVARGCRDTQSSRNLIEQINRSCVNGNIRNLNFNGADNLWKKHINNLLVKDILAQHAYENTIFTSLFLFARQDGVFAAADFLWLKPYDRKFWYVLNSVGRQTPFCESAGVHAHFLTEKALMRPMGVPMVEEASNGLELALSEIIYVPSREEQEELIKQAQAQQG